MTQPKTTALAAVQPSAIAATTQAGSELLTDADLSRESQIPRGTLRALRHRGQIPFLRLGGGRIIRYRRADIDAWLAAHVVAGGTKDGGK